MLLRPLFRKIDVSCLTLNRLWNVACHPQLSVAVEELFFHEMDFDIDLRAGSFGDEQTELLCKWITEFMVKSYSFEVDFNPQCSPQLLDFLAKDWDLPMPDTIRDSAEGARPLSDPDDKEIKSMIKTVLKVYATRAVLQKPRHLYEIFRSAFPRLQNLQRIIFVEAGAGGIALGIPGNNIRRKSMPD